MTSAQRHTCLSGNSGKLEFDLILTLQSWASVILLVRSLRFFIYTPTCSRARKLFFWGFANINSLHSYISTASRVPAH